MNKKLHFVNQDNSSEDDLMKLQEMAINSPQKFPYGDENEAEAAANVVSLNIKDNHNDEQTGGASKNSFLEKNIVITGSISSVTTIEIEGQVNGNVTCKNDVLVSGAVTGDISAVNVKITSGQVKGNIGCKSSVVLDRDSFVKGNITGENLECDGKVEGNSKIQARAMITGNAVIHGDIVASRIKIDEGVEIRGRLQVSQNTADGGRDSGDSSEQ